MSEQPPEPGRVPPAQPDPIGEENPQPAPPAQWAWVKPVVQPQLVETPPLEYHELFRGTRRYRWWKPLLAVVLGAIYYFTLSVVFTIPFIPYLLSSGALSLADPALDASNLVDTQRPVLILMSIGSVALMLPAALLAMLSVGLTPAGRLWSVALRIRWRWILRSLLPALVALMVMNALGIALDLATGSGSDLAGTAASRPGFDPQAALWSFVFVVLLVPLQATAEELVYRGMFMQTLGAWLGSVRGATAFAAFLRGPWLPIAIPAIAFGFSHIYDVWGWISVVVLALVAGWLSWRTGGLEAAIGLHIVNNIVAFGFLASGITGETAQVSESGGFMSALTAVIGFALYGWWMDRDFRRKDGVRTRIDLVEQRSA